MEPDSQNKRNLKSFLVFSLLTGAMVQGEMVKVVRTNWINRFCELISHVLKVCITDFAKRPKFTPNTNPISQNYSICATDQQQTLKDHC